MGGNGGVVRTLRRGGQFAGEPGNTNNLPLDLMLRDPFLDRHLPKVNDVLCQVALDVAPPAALGKHDTDAQGRVRQEAGLHPVRAGHTDVEESSLQFPIVQEHNTHGLIQGQAVGQVGA